MRIGIMSAMREEIDMLLHSMTKVETRTESGKREYYQGILWNYQVVLVFSRWGKVAAATTATHLISHYGVGKIIFTGVAGSVQQSINVGDIIVASELLQHDMDARPLFQRHEIPLLGLQSFQTESILRKKLFSAAYKFLHTDLMKEVSVENLKEFNILAPRAIEAPIASGDKFFSDVTETTELKNRLPEISCVEMEGAAVAQVCYEHNIPYGVIRTISDSADHSAHVDFQKFISSVASIYSWGILKQYFQIGNK